MGPRSRHPSLLSRRFGYHLVATQLAWMLLTALASPAAASHPGTRASLRPATP